MSLFHVMAAALVAAAALIVWQWLEVRRLRSLSDYLSRRLERAHSAELAAEARSRGVGGTGEHGAPVVTPIGSVSRSWMVRVDPRHSIPTDRRP